MNRAQWTISTRLEKWALRMASVLLLVGGLPIAAGAQASKPASSGVTAQLAEAWKAEPVKATIYPGESVSLMRVTVTWNPPEKPITAATTKKTALSLRLEGPSSQIIDFKLRSGGPPTGGTIAYLDQTFFMFEPDNSEVQRVYVYALRIPSAIWFGGPRDEADVAVSNAQTMQVNHYKLRISDAPVEYSGGKSYYQLEIVDEELKETVAIPALSGSVRKVGRYRFDIREFCEETKTTQIRIQADADPTVRGRDALVKGPIVFEKDMTLGDFLENLATDYGFSVVWQQASGHPESVQFVKNLPYSGLIDGTKWFENSTISKVLSILTNHLTNDIELQWSDETHLVVNPKNYDKYLAEQEAQQDYMETIEREKKENQKQVREIEQEVAARVEELRVTIAYPLKSLTPVAAKMLVDPLLSEYIIGRRAPGKETSENSSATRSTLQPMLKQDARTAHLLWAENNPAIDSATGKRQAPITGKITEVAAADEKANALIVTAIPETHKKIEELLKKADSLAAQEPGQAPKIYQVSVDLLKGVDAAPTSAAGLSAPPDPSISSVYPPAAEIRFEGIPCVLKSAKAGPNGVEVTYGTNQTGTQKPAPIDLPTREEPLFYVDLIVDGQWSHPEEEAEVILRYFERNTEEPKSAAPSNFGLSPDDLKEFGLEHIERLAGGNLNLAAHPGGEGKAQIGLSGNYRCELQFLSERPPYLVVRARLLETDAKERIDAAPTVLLENTLYLEKDKPSILGLTNLREALMLVVKLE